MSNNLTIFNLLMFNTTPLNEKEKEYFNFDKNIIKYLISKLDNDNFYLGGQIKMKHNDIINLNLIDKVREINKKKDIIYGGPCNSFELASIYKHLEYLQFIENMIIKYNYILELREKN